MELKPLEQNNHSDDQNAETVADVETHKSNQKLRRRNFIQEQPVLAYLILLIVFFGGYVIGRNNYDALLQTSLQGTAIEESSGGQRVDFGLFWEAWDLLGSSYVDQDSLEPKQLMYGAIKGMFAATGDQHTTFFNPEVNESFKEDMRGSFDGIGAEIGIEDSILTIISPLDDSPAQKAGLRAGDKIIEIDGEITSELNINDAVDKIRGVRGSEVLLTIYREGENDTREVAVKRDKIVIQSIKLEFREDDISMLRVAQFGNDTASDFRKAVTEIQQSGSKKVVIDLRNNPGGLLDGAVKMIGYLVAPNSTVVLEKSSTGELESLETNGIPILDESYEYVVLINGGSASASEIMAAAMKELMPDRVTLVGETSFGKGSVQELVPMKDGTAAKITIAKWLTPNEVQIDGVGINPDTEVEITEDDFEAGTDPQLNEALRIFGVTEFANAENNDVTDQDTSDNLSEDATQTDETQESDPLE